MVRYENTISIKQFAEDELEHLVELGIMQKIKLYAASTRFEVQMIPLYSGQIQHLKNNIPNKCVIRIDGDPYDLYPMPQFCEHLISQGKAININILDLRVVAEHVQPFLTSKKTKAKNSKHDISSKARNTLLKLVATISYVAYKYDASDKKSTVPKEISDDIQMTIDEQVLPETVRSYLKEACEKFPKISE